ncbi:type I-E CRISPR-associated protein Cse2/CasB [Streptomyces sp. NWU339]|uniref:type I-E CRISPR-associated protein Cse2/CasB n=1 Tax=Streptomyces sp. NWU339 TaxID=2185284 RepID=UPI000D673E48|nr:type I-E CRISPR-associated protein Cse2/CasB [Streptomyces sp. NWU339]PWI05754.1 type I-E CRISPR-associated protein Cse2/CasB [Streptomyces sp. NWU339]
MTTTTPHVPHPRSGQPDQAPAAPGRAAAAQRRSRQHAFTTWVEQTCVHDPGARAALRSGVRKNLDQVPHMHRLIARWLPENAAADTERAYYAIAAMIAAQPRTAYAAAHTPEQTGPDSATASGPARPYGVSLGTAFAAAVTQAPGREKQMRQGTAESRLNLLTRQSVNGLHRHLPAAVAYLRAVGAPVDWTQLLDDLSHWRRHSARIARRWLQDYYRARAKTERDAADLADQQEAEQTGPTEPAAP